MITDISTLAISNNKYIFYIDSCVESTCIGNQRKVEASMEEWGFKKEQINKYMRMLRFYDKIRFDYFDGHVIETYLAGKKTPWNHKISN